MMNSSAANFATSSVKWHSRVCTRRFIFIEDELFIHTPFLTCRITKLPFILNRVPIAMALNKNSPFGEQFNRQVIRIQELGFLTCIKQRVMPGLIKEGTGTGTGNNFKPIEWQQTIPLVSLYCASLLLSIGILISELIYFHLKPKRIRHHFYK